MTQRLASLNNVIVPRHSGSTSITTPFMCSLSQNVPFELCRTPETVLQW